MATEPEARILGWRSLAAEAWECENWVIEALRYYANIFFDRFELLPCFFLAVLAV